MTEHFSVTELQTTDFAWSLGLGNSGKEFAREQREMKEERSNSIVYGKSPLLPLTEVEM